MKAALAAIVILMSSLAASATTATPPGCYFGTSKATSCLAMFYGPVSVSTFFPCLNSGKGENVTFTDTEATIFYYTVTNGKRNGFFMFVGGGPMQGKGQTTGINYQANGSEQYTFTDWVPFNPDGSPNGDGAFNITDNYHLHSDRPLTNHSFHRTQQFTTTNNGNNFTEQPTVTICK